MRVYLTLILILTFALAVAAQQTPDYSGVWVYNKVVSQPEEPLRTATFKTFITQTPTEIKIGTLETTQGAQILDNQTPTDEITYYFDKQNKAPAQSSSKNSALKAKVERIEKGVLSVVTEEVVKAPNGKDVTLKIRQTFERLPDGETLKIHRQVFVDKTFPMLEIYLAKSQPTGTVIDYPVIDILNLKAQFPKATLNSKVKHFRDPDYPDYVKNDRVMNSASIKVIFDETGKVIFAQSLLPDSITIKSEAAEAAMQCVFDPVAVNGNPIRVSGKIIYTIGGPLQPWK